MPYFATALQRWFQLTPTDCTLSDLATDADLPQSEVSRYRSGARKITLQALTKLLPAIEARSNRTDAVRLLIAYLRDETPPTYEPDVQISATDASTYINDGTPQTDPLDLMARRWRDKAERDPSFAEMWITLDGYMSSTPEATDASLDSYRSTTTRSQRLTDQPSTYGSPQEFKDATNKLLGP